MNITFPTNWIQSLQYCSLLENFLKSLTALISEGSTLLDLVNEMNNERFAIKVIITLPYFRKQHQGTATKDLVSKYGWSRFLKFYDIIRLLENEKLIFRVFGLARIQFNLLVVINA